MGPTSRKMECEICECCFRRRGDAVTCAGCARRIERYDVLVRATIMRVRFFFCREECYLFWLNTLGIPHMWVLGAQECPK